LYDNINGTSHKHNLKKKTLKITAPKKKKQTSNDKKTNNIFIVLEIIVLYETKQIKKKTIMLFMYV